MSFNTNSIKTSSTQNESAAIAKEYQDYAYVVSHDFNAILRHIKEFSRLLIELHPTDISEEEKTCIQFLQRSLAKLEDMQDALLTFSRIHTHVCAAEPVDATDLFMNALDRVKIEYPEYYLRVEIQHAPLPHITVDPLQLSDVFFHLLSNAVKFHDDSGKIPHVFVSCQKYEGTFVFEVRDNGIGIPEEHYKNVFQFFRRLHGEGEYPGLGTGLTLTKRIINRHHGDIWIESDPKEGSSVFFSIPHLNNSDRSS